jgi:hypothetical protein
MSDLYGDHQVIRCYSSGGVMRVWAKHVRTGERLFFTVPVLTVNER